MSNSCSNCSSDLAEADPYAPAPVIRAWSSSGIVHDNDSGRRVAIKTNVSSSASPGENLVHSAVASGCGSPLVARSLRTSTGANSNHSPKALQKGVSFARLRILYEMTTVGGTTSGGLTSGGDVRWSKDRSRGASNSGKYT